VKVSEEAQPFAAHLERNGYWPAVANRKLREGRFADAIHLCKKGLTRLPDHLSGRMVYAMAVFRGGQMQTARTQIHKVLELDPEHLGALKLLGDIDYREGDIPAALVHYRRVFEIDPPCTGLKSALGTRPASSRKVTLRRESENVASTQKGDESRIPFFTETMGNLYLRQGHSRLAAEVFKKLLQEAPNDRLQAKLTQAERGGKETENN